MLPLLLAAGGDAPVDTYEASRHVLANLQVELAMAELCHCFEELRVGRRCEVTQIDAHPLGGRRAANVRLLEERVAVIAPAAPEVDRSAWLLERIGQSLDGAVANVEVQGLLDAYLVFSGRAPKPHVFGVTTAQVSRGRWPELAAAAERALRGWKARLGARSPHDAYLLDKAGRDLKLDFLQGQKVELRCEPLGTLDDLNPDWVARLNRLRKQLKQRPALERGGLEDARKFRWGKPDRAALREAALAWRLRARPAFSWSALLDQLKDSFNWHFENGRELHRQQQRWKVLRRLERQHRLAGHPYLAGELFLGELAVLEAKPANVVCGTKYFGRTERLLGA